MADLYGTNNDRSFSSSSSLESEDMSSFLQSFLNNSSTKGKYGRLFPSPPPISTDFVDSDQRQFSDLSSFYGTETTNQVNFQPRQDLAGFDLGCQVQKQSEGRQSSNPPRSSKRTRAAEIHNLSEKRRRSRINEKLKALQTLVPNSNKTDKASMLDEAIEYLKQLQLKVQALTMRNGLGLQQPIYSQQEEMQRGMGPNPSQNQNQNQGGFSIDIGGNGHMGMLPSSSNMMKQDNVFGSEVNQYHHLFANHSTSIKEMGCLNGKIPSPGVS